MHMRKIRCKICNTWFAASRYSRYMVPERNGLFHNKERMIECFDCPSCGCQNAVNVRVLPPQPERPGLERPSKEATPIG
jgi:hypothetical protein